MRQSERMKLNEPARLRPNEWSSLEVHILDFSGDGFRAECDARIMVGSRVSIDVPGFGTVDAQVKWYRDGEIGAKFLVPIELERCEWRPAAAESVLVRLLYRRAEACASGSVEQERRLRRQILESLPFQSLKH